MKDENIIILYQCFVTVDSIVKSDVLAYRQCLFSYYTSGTCALQLPTLAKAHVGTTFLKGEVGHGKILVPSVESISYLLFHIIKYYALHIK